MQQTLLIASPYLSIYCSENFKLVCLTSLMIVQKLENSNNHLTPLGIARFLEGDC
jgi:hypothetical protein